MASQQQPPARPWFRLTSMARPAAPAPPPPPPAAAAAAPAPPPAPQPRPSFIRPTFTQTTQPPPPPPPAATITSSVPSSPIIRTSTPPSPKPPQTSTTTLPIDSSSLPPSPKTRTSVPSSPLTAPPAPKPVSSYPAPPPPSLEPVTAAAVAAALTTKPSSPSPKMKRHDHQSNIPPEAEQKTVLVQETIEKPKMMPRTFDWNLQRHVAENQTKDIVKAKDHKKLSDSEEFGTRIITLAGENKGAIMELNPHFYKKQGFTGKPRSLREKSGIDSSSSSSSDEEGRKKNKDKSQIGMGMTSSPPFNGFMNSNVQGVNNSILYNCSCTHHDPGIHLSLSRKTNDMKDQNT